ncbi:hypothetical protein L3Y34_004862 [Caenorhabditis briggsae]|uniref:Uncharacterized protein n=2 Tax=Caenorhabditis briggsae TaxID=6238 RepID=A0AAE9AAF8_CAEBR|nr:hypothetical protein L3Y34_004862 [Caenorhabditis briggsae]
MAILEYLFANVSSEDVDNSTNQTINLNEKYIHSSTAMTAAYIVLITFIFYVPRIIYYRLSRFSKDRQLPGYFLLWYLSLIPCIAGCIHFSCYQVFVSGTPELHPDTFEDQVYSYYLLKSAAFSINRLVAPIVAILCIQQIATHTQWNITIFQETAVHMILCLFVTIFVAGYTFGREYFLMRSLDSSSTIYPDHIHLDLFDLISPAITVVLFWFARQNLERQSVYSLERCGPNDPSILDRISKISVFHGVMLIFTIGGILMAPSERDELKADPSDGHTSIFFISAQTPFVHWVLLRSLLRSKKPTRLCFLFCFGDGEKVAPAPDDVEMGDRRAGNKNRNQKTEEEEEDDDDEPETLDANKIVILPESQAEEIIRREAMEVIEVREFKPEEDIQEEQDSETSNLEDRLATPVPNSNPNGITDN